MDEAVDVLRGWQQRLGAAERGVQVDTEHCATRLHQLALSREQTASMRPAKVGANTAVRRGDGGARMMSMS